MRIAIYARYSSEKQSESSIDDQTALCRDYAARKGFQVEKIYSDAAKSGSSLFGRDGLLSLLADAQKKIFDAVLVENLDRISRDQEDIAGIYKRLTHCGIRIEQVHGGRADKMQIGLRGLLGSIYLEDLAHKTKRGMEGRVRDGKVAGGKPYAYRAVAGRPGEFEIIDAEAEIVRRIFREYASGRSARTIAHALNADAVPAPRGTAWTASAIGGGKGRGTGILRVELYRGRIVWGKMTYSRDPDTGKRISRLNPQAEWKTSNAPALRIVDNELWEAVEARLATTGKTGTPLNRPRRKHLLSGMIKCGTCGSGMALNGVCGGRYRILCSRYRESRTCSHGRTYYLDEAESIVVGALQSLFAEPEALQAYVDAYVNERRRLIVDMTKKRNRAEADLHKVKEARFRMEKRMIYGEIDDATFRRLKPEMDREVSILESELARVEAPPKIDLHPKAVEAYKLGIDRLASAMSAGIKTSNEAIVIPLRDLVHSVVVHPVAKEAKMTVEIIGKLSALTGDGVANMMVAGAGFEPAAFRL